ncbi:conserved hypothetical protein [Xylanimonas cellulosilytica DSM 15894]|uniref:DUF4334 domain-containing protein n=1 Tax=Xylanimonas cellulosilytica (strain DSM 15894 / JCM 12276 / CECT 5975 / KCTC 9989 / LMG 20990 / NBRC 107835 / XIL07) TaxID=446471 RepID=D1BRR5_XYLCX|nr:DUF4334 domain-containing protein [Xylanimonas cellulosilytica]ACZ32331.1 conserved hypothetical protein [Xylanimonas cellulosilytica DSM 15894]
MHEASPAALAALERGTTTAEAFAFFDALPAVGVDEVLGRWRGSGLPTGHPLDGVLEALGWHGKRFAGPLDAHPLICDDGRGGLVDVNPAFVPLPLLLRFPAVFRHPVVARPARAALPLLGTRRPRARLRSAACRGVVTATMTYDALPIDDAFRAVDDDTLLGLMEARGMRDPFFFVLRRATAAARTPL